MRVSNLIVTIVMVFGLITGMILVSQPVSVFASTYFHGDFATNSQSCAGCHRVHFAETESLLVSGTDETEFCYYCHGNSNGGASSGYNVETGMINGIGGQRPSYAGGFSQSIDPSRSYPDNVVFDNTSVHSIESALRLGQLSQLKDGDIPGGGSWVGSFKCGSCHDPHEGGQYPSNGDYKNPRLLRKTLLDDTQHFVYMSIDYGNTNLPLAYGAGFNQWCGGCHDIFNTEGSERSGSTGYSNGSVMKFRHKVGVDIPDHVFSTDLGTGLPVPTDTKGNGPGVSQWRLNCLTCHRAHGSSVNVSIGFTRFKDYNSTESYGDDEQQSALLRLPERGVCVRCHGSAEFNNYSGDYSTGW